MEDRAGPAPRRLPYGFLTVDEVAAFLQLPAAEVVRLLEEGALHGTRVGRSWRVNPWSLIPVARALLEEGPPQV